MRWFYARHPPWMLGAHALRAHKVFIDAWRRKTLFAVRLQIYNFIFEIEIIIQTAHAHKRDKHSEWSEFTKHKNCIHVAPLHLLRGSRIRMVFFYCALFISAFSMMDALVRHKLQQCKKPIFNEHNVWKSHFVSFSFLLSFSFQLTLFY